MIIRVRQWVRDAWEQAWRRERPWENVADCEARGHPHPVTPDGRRCVQCGKTFSTGWGGR